MRVELRPLRLGMARHWEHSCHAWLLQRSGEGRVVGRSVFFPFFSQYFCPIIQSADRLIEICFTFLETCFFKNVFSKKYLKYVSLFWKLCFFKHIRPIRFDLEHGHCQNTMVGPRGQSVDVYVALLFSNDPTQTHRARALQVSECYTCWWYSLCNLKY